jgi:hypothetical protein
VSGDARFGVGAALALGLLAFGLHAANLLYVAHTQGCASLALVCPADPSRAWSTPDTEGYVRIAERARAGGLGELETIFRGPGYPLMLAAALALFGTPTPALWFAAALAGLAAAAMASLASRLAGHRGAGWAAGGMFCLWLSSYSLSALLLTDATHAYLAVIAFALTVAWRANGRIGTAAIAGAAWMATQALRPTFDYLAVLLPVLLWKRGAGRRYWRVSACLWLASLFVPVAITINNWQGHGVAVTSALPSLGLACETGSLIRARLGEGRFHRLRADCWRRYEGRPWAEVIPAQWREARARYRAAPSLALRLHIEAFQMQMLHPLTPRYSQSLASAYPAWARVGGTALLLFWLAAAASLLMLLRREPAVALFLLLAAALVMLPASHTRLAGPRYRLTLDLLCVPVVAAGATALLREAMKRRRASG